MARGSGRDGNYADREFDLDDLVLTAPLAQTAKPPVMDQTDGFALYPGVSVGTRHRWVSDR